MENYLDRLSTLLEKKSNTKTPNSLLSTIQTNQIQELRIALQTIQQVRPDIVIDEATYTQVVTMIEELDDNIQTQVTNLLTLQTASRKNIVAALVQSTPIFVPPTALTEASAATTKTTVTRLPGDYIRLYKEEFLKYLAGVLRTSYKIKNITALKPNSKEFNNLNLTLEYAHFTYTKDAKNLLNNLGNIVGLGNLNFTKLLEEIEKSDPSGETVPLPTSHTTTAKTAIAKQTVVKEKVSRQFGVFADVMKDAKKIPGFKKHILEAMQKSFYPETPDQTIDPAVLDDDALDISIDLDYDGIKFQGTIKSALTGMSKLVYQTPLNVDKIMSYLLDKTRQRKYRGQVVNNEQKEEKGENNDGAASRLMDIVFDTKYGFPAAFPGRLPEIVGHEPNRFDGYIQKGVTSIKSTLGGMTNKNILDYPQVKIRLYLPNQELQDTTVGNFLESIAYIKHNTYDTTLIASELFPPTNGVAQQPKPQVKVEVKFQSTPEPTTKVTPIPLANAHKFQELMIHQYSELCIAAKKSCNDKEERPEKYNQIIAMLDVMAASIEAIKDSINTKNFAAARRMINGYKKMENVTIASLFAKESNACFMIKEIHEKLTTKDHGKL